MESGNDLSLVNEAQYLLINRNSVKELHTHMINQQQTSGASENIGMTIVISEIAIWGVSYLIFRENTQARDYLQTPNMSAPF